MSALITLFNGLILTAAPLILIYFSGGLHSPVFFLIYILFFGLALLFDPVITLSLSLALALVFSQQVKAFNDLLPIFGMLMITPIAVFFGKQYLRILENEEKIKIITKKKNILQNEVTQQEEDTLLWLALAFKEQVSTIMDNTSNLLTDLSRLTPQQKDKIQKIHESSIKLLQLGNKLRERIEG